jgi:hypothetical protein
MYKALGFIGGPRPNPFRFGGENPENNFFPTVRSEQEKIIFGVFPAKAKWVRPGSPKQSESLIHYKHRANDWEQVSTCRKTHRSVCPGVLFRKGWDPRARRGPGGASLWPVPFAWSGSRLFPYSLGVNAGCLERPGRCFFFLATARPHLKHSFAFLRVVNEHFRCMLSHSHRLEQATTWSPPDSILDRMGGGMDEPPRGAEFARKQSVCSPPTAKADRTPAVDICHDTCTIDYMNYLQKSTDFPGPSAANCVDSRPFDRASTVF